MLRALMQDLAVCLVFLSRLPVRLSDQTVAERPIARAMRAFPVAGAILGSLGGMAYALAAWAGLPSLACAGIALGTIAWATGAFHEDALADVADGLGGGQTKSQKLEIMVDSRVGTFATVALVLTLLIKASVLAGIGEAGGGWGVIACLIASGAWSRALILPVKRYLPPAKDIGASHDAGRPSRQTMLEALGAGALIAVIAAGPGTFLAAGVAAAGGTALIARMGKRQLAGHTGDLLGASQQAAELAFLAVALIVAA